MHLLVSSAKILWRKYKNEYKEARFSLKKSVWSSHQTVSWCPSCSEEYTHLQSVQSCLLFQSGQLLNGSLRFFDG